MFRNRSYEKCIDTYQYLKIIFVPRSKVSAYYSFIFDGSEDIADGTYSLCGMRFGCGKLLVMIFSLAAYYKRYYKRYKRISVINPITEKNKLTRFSG